MDAMGYSSLFFFFFFVLAFLGQEKIGSASTLSSFPPEDCPPQSIQTTLHS
jgi:hypothetical protein